MRGRGLFFRKGPSLALPPEKTGERKNSGGGRFSKRSASPGPPPEEWLGIGLVALLALSAHASWARFPANRLRSRRLTEPPRPCGERDFASADARRGRSPSGSFPIAPATPSAPTYKLMPKPNVGRSRRLCQPPRPQLRFSETHPPSGGTPYEERRKPNASRSSGEGVWGRGASLREAASPPESPVPSLAVTSPSRLLIPSLLGVGADRRGLHRGRGWSRRRRCC